MWRRVRKIGILGGMGPAATVDFLTKIVAATPAHCDQEHIPVIVWSDPRTPDRTLALLNPDSPSPVPALRDGAMALEKAGADFIAIACNTAHHWHHCIQKATTIPVLHIADVAVDELARTEVRAGGAIGLMGTNGIVFKSLRNATGSSVQARSSLSAPCSRSRRAVCIAASRPCAILPAFTASIAVISVACED
jgi:aspartate racemase